MVLHRLVSDSALEKPYKLFQGENSYAEVQVTNLEGIKGIKDIKGKLSVEVFPL